MGTFVSFRRAYGALKDSTTVSLAKVSSEFKNLDIAIVKATNHEECPPKEQHVRRIIVGTSFAVPRADVGYCIHALSRRLMKTKNWIVAVKILMVFHRVLREGDPSFREELLNYSRRIHIFQILEFRDDSSHLACDCSSWIRRYAMFLEERLECYRVSGFDIENERLTTATGIGKAYSRMRLMNVDELLDQLPAMQQLLYRLIVCQPEGAACHNSLIQQALALVFKESFKIYSVINDGVIKLVESFFNMSKDKAVPALNIYKKAGKQAEQLAELYNLGKHMRLAMNIQFPTLNQPPPSFLATMEEYVKGVSLKGSASNKKLEHQNAVEERSAEKTKEPVTREVEEVEKKEVLQDQEPEPKTRPKVEEVLPLIAIDDNDPAGLTETNPKAAAELEDNNGPRSTLAIVQPGTTSSGYNETEKPSNWPELAVVTTSSNSKNINTILHAKPGGDQSNKLLLYGLYENDITRKQPQPQHTGYNPGYEYQPQRVPSMTSSGVVSPATVQMVMSQQQQQQMVNQQQYQNQYQQWYRDQQQQNMFVPYNHQQSSNQYGQRPMCNPIVNPFGDTINHPQGNRGLI
ncbi:putative clathrin assembly protein At5g57200 [Cynara cardunculus var. scolymus]|uniref:putative clathrin assembly protein At5g57200 n=1 Tax=Cynara cardunculus var. scolymus TaxID=59895 RepID=UPI000D62476B|nr:putative clathrin assembly protein At5g57200 [Cynara cardunculus var. scolymus]